jgi:hypothetical protein
MCGSADSSSQRVSGGFQLSVFQAAINLLLQLHTSLFRHGHHKTQPLQPLLLDRPLEP